MQLKQSHHIWLLKENKKEHKKLCTRSEETAIKKGEVVLLEAYANLKKGSSLACFIHILF